MYVTPTAICRDEALKRRLPCRVWFQKVASPAGAKEGIGNTTQSCSDIYQVALDRRVWEHLEIRQDDRSSDSVIGQCGKARRLLQRNPRAFLNFDTKTIIHRPHSDAPNTAFTNVAADWGWVKTRMKW
jgi:hypothetical protein